VTTTAPKLVLASGSWARLRVLRDAGFDPDVAVSGVDETVGQMTTAEAVLVLAERKVSAVASRYSDALVLGCDSMLELDGRSLGKPQSHGEIVDLWGQLAGRHALLWTGHFLIDTRSRVCAREVAGTVIRFGRPRQEELSAYAATGDGLNLAGAFSIEGRSGPFVEAIDGSPSNVLGLSLPHFRSMVSHLGVQIFDLWRESDPVDHLP
jgi:septum formation protein